MTRRSIRLGLAAGLLLGTAAAACAQGNSGSGSGLSPYASESGNDRSAGVNNGNYRPPRLGRGYDGQGYASQDYDGRGYGRPVYERRPRAPGRYYGYPY